MEYEEALSLVHSSTKIGAREGFSRIRHILKKLGDPQDKVPYVHVAGTNGKGSTCAMTAAILKEAGYKTGLFVSPFISDFRERIQCGGELIEKEEFVRICEKVFAAIRESREEGFDPTEFEVNTILALCWYADIGCDIGVLEVGLGGRLDPTNVIPTPLVSAITSISLDHTAILGDTVEEIAGEKCGILKPGTKCVAYGDMDPRAMSVVSKKCEELSIPCHRPAIEALSVFHADGEGTDFIYKNEPYFVALPGKHQVMNALTAIEICRRLSECGFQVPERAIKKGLETVKFTGRLETVCDEPLTVIDGAHNPAKINALVTSLGDLWPEKTIVSIMGIFKDKDYETCIKTVAEKSRVFIAVAPENERALPAEEVKRLAEKYCSRVIMAGSLKEGVNLALQNAGEDDMIVATGSMYIIGEIKKLFTTTPEVST